jgi:hypothetical protein
MKKAMLFFVALFFSVAANAATITVGPAGASKAVQVVFQNLGYGVGEQDGWASAFEVTTDVDTDALITWTFNPQPTSGLVGVADGLTPLVVLNVAGSKISTTVALKAGVTYGVGFAQIGQSSPTAYSLSVSAVPVPAAAFLFAPALVGFMALRRKAAKAA